MRREHDVDRVLGTDLSDQGEHLVALHRVESVGRFVEEDQTWVGGDRLGELDALTLPGRHRAEGTEPFLAEADQPQCIARPAAGLVARQSAHLGEVLDEVGRRHVLGQDVALRAVADEGTEFGTLGRRVEAQHGRRSGRGTAQPEQDRHQGRLAGAVGPDQAGDAARHLDIERVEGAVRAELHRQSGRGNDTHSSIMAHRSPADVVLLADSPSSRRLTRTRSADEFLDEFVEDGCVAHGGVVVVHDRDQPLLVEAGR